MESLSNTRRRKLAFLLCFSAALVLLVGIFWARSYWDTYTDNAYIRGEVTSLAPKVSGYVRSVEVRDNQTVKAGQVLFRIDDEDFRARLAQATANIEAAEARLVNVDAEIELQHSLVRQAQALKLSNLAEFALAAKTSERRHNLIRENAISQALVDEGDAARLRGEAGVSAATATLDAQSQRIVLLAAQRRAAVAAVDQAKALRDLAQIDLDNTVVRAPVGGVIGNRNVRVGRLVAPGASLLDIVPLDNVWVIANFKETQLASIKVGQSVRITVDGYPDNQYEGVVDSFAPGSGSAFSLLPPDNATGNFVRVVQRVPVKIRFLKPSMVGRLVPGLSARVEIGRGRGL